MKEKLSRHVSDRDLLLRIRRSCVSRSRKIRSPIGKRSPSRVTDGCK
ncbi:hypothetical protein HMPREF9440_00421 [Sutterella parvirubra YIT 11816]|uniref:Uncharacterized protein n=1 Tax=Sutterella parvirubra YIT 11816 TaxID=762967 RepID=H3KCG9_9BURK|nr:hypothetical protein HMPREF9440_00421 [Sutterella parvirubra YIT 11816]